MQLDNYMKIKITEIIQKNAINNIFYSDFTDLIKKTKNKYNNEDIVLYLIEKFIKELPKENTKLLVKIIFSISLITDYSAEDLIMFSKDTTDKIISLVIECKEKENNEQLNEAIITLDDTLKNCYPQLELKQETIEETSEDIKELETKLNEAKEEIIKLETKSIELQKKINTQSKANETLKKQKIALTEIKNNLEIELKQLKEHQTIKDNEILSLKAKIEAYDKQYKELLTKIETVEKDYNEQVQTLIDTNNQLKENIKVKEAKLDEIDKQTKQQQKELLRHNQITDVILTELYKYPKITIDGIIQNLKRLNINTTHQEIHQHLIELKQRINIEGPIFDYFLPSYQIDKTAPVITKPFEYYVNDYTKALNILLVSDMHITSMVDLSTLQIQNDTLYNYSAANNIKMIFNLGDTFETYSYITDKNIANLHQLEELVKKFITSTPSNSGIYQGLLGGNHDKEFLEFGINPLEIISSQREDLINLGYNHRKIQLGNDSNQLVLHHPERRFQEIGLFNQDLENYFNSLYYYYQNRNNIYCDLIGHTHKSKLDAANSYCMVPSYTRDRIQNGCWHLKIYFDDNQKINYINFIPLIVRNDKLIPISEITYQKVRKR